MIVTTSVTSTSPKCCGILESNLKLACVLERKEIENYLLVPAALDRAVVRTLNARRERGAEKATSQVDSAKLLEDITRPMKEEILAQLMARRHDYLGHTGEDKSRLYKHVLGPFDSRWANLDARISVVPGKEVLRLFRQRVQDLCGVTLTDARIAESISRRGHPSRHATTAPFAGEFPHYSALATRGFTGRSRSTQTGRRAKERYWPSSSLLG